MTDIDNLTFEEPSKEGAVADRHLKHWRGCNCLADKAECCDPTCTCHV